MHLVTVRAVLDGLEAVGYVLGLVGEELERRWVEEVVHTEFLGSVFKQLNFGRLCFKKVLRLLHIRRR